MLFLAISFYSTCSCIPVLSLFNFTGYEELLNIGYSEYWRSNLKLASCSSTSWGEYIWNWVDLTVISSRPKLFACSHSADLRVEVWTLLFFYTTRYFIWANAKSLACLWGSRKQQCTKRLSDFFTSNESERVMLTRFHLRSRNCH